MAARTASGVDRATPKVGGPTAVAYGHDFEISVPITLSYWVISVLAQAGVVGVPSTLGRAYRHLCPDTGSLAKCRRVFGAGQHLVNRGADTLAGALMSSLG